LVANYFEVFKNHLRQLAVKVPEIPVGRLGVGDDELKAPIAIPLYLSQGNKQQKFPALDVKTVDDYYQSNIGRQYRNEDFPRTGWIGGGY